MNKNINNFKLLIIFWNNYISNNISNFKYFLNYNLNISITDNLGIPIFFNYLNFNLLNVFNDSLNNIKNNEKILLFLYNSYINNQNNYSLIEQKIVKKTIYRKNKNWKKINNFNLRYTRGGDVTFTYNNEYVDTKLIYDFRLTDSQQQGGKAFPYIPKSNTYISCDFYGNFYIFDKTIKNPYTINILFFNSTIYIWGKIATSDYGSNIEVFGSTGLYTSLKNNDDTYKYYGFYCNSQRNNNKAVSLPYYITSPLLKCGDYVITFFVDCNQTAQYIYTNTGTDIGIYNNSKTNPNTACLVSGGYNYNDQSSYYLIKNDIYKTNGGSLVVPELFTINIYWGSASIINNYGKENEQIYLYQSFNNKIYYFDEISKTQIIVTDSNGISIIPDNFLPTGITSHTDITTLQSFLYVAYYDTTVLQNNGNSYLTYIYKYILSDTNGSLTYVSRITGGYSGLSFYNIGFMTGNMVLTTTGLSKDYIIYCYEYTLNYSISRIISIAF